MGNWMSGLASDGPGLTLDALSPPGDGDKILIPVDGSEHSANAVEFYLQKLHKPGVEVVFFHAVQHPYVSSDAVSDNDSVNDFDRRIEDLRDSDKALENRYLQKLKDYRVANYRMIGMEGKPGESIIKAALWEKPTMIIMGSRGLGPIARTVLGSVSDYVMSHADVPVLVHKTKRNRFYSNAIQNKEITGPSDKAHRFF